MVSVKGCQGFRKTKLRNGGRVLLTVLMLCVGIKIRAATFDTNNSVTEKITQSSNQSLLHSRSFLIKSVRRVGHTVDVSDEMIGLRLAVDFYV